MAEAPRDFQAGRPLRDELTADRLNKILAAVRRSKPLSGRGIAVYETGAGTRIDLADNRRGRGGVAPDHPFQLTVTTDPEGSPDVEVIRVRYGTINGVAPTGMTVGDEPPYFLTPSGTEGIIYAVVVFDRSVASCPILSRDLGMDAELPTDDQETAHIEIGSYNTVDDRIVVAQAVSGSLFVDPYGFTFLWGNV